MQRVCTKSPKLLQGPFKYSCLNTSSLQLWWKLWQKWEEQAATTFFRYSTPFAMVFLDDLRGWESTMNNFNLCLFISASSFTYCFTICQKQSVPVTSLYSHNIQVSLARLKVMHFYYFFLNVTTHLQIHLRRDGHCCYAVSTPSIHTIVSILFM